MDRIDFLKDKANELRMSALETISHFGSGHVGGVMSVMDALTVIYYDKANVNPSNPNMWDRDRVVMSKGHAGPAMYAVLADKGYFPREWLTTLNKGGTNLPSHCDMLKTPGIDMTAGSLGQGISCAVGMAYAAKLDKNPCTIYCFVGDGESQEGEVWEASMFASAKKLDNFILLLDYNKKQLDGAVKDVNDLGDVVAKWKAFGFDVQDIDGHDVVAISNAIDNAKVRDGKPHMIVLNTIKGKGVTFAECLPNCHSVPVTHEQYLEEKGRA